MRPSGIEKSYSTAARKLLESQNTNDSQKIINDLINKLHNRIPFREIFVAKFSRIKYFKGYTYYKKLIQYIFESIELYNRETTEFRPNNITLEHILSQSNQNKDKIGAIGNLLPLSQKLNEEADNKDLTDKLEIYQKSSFFMTKQFVNECLENNKTSWTPEDIKERTRKLAEYCYDEVWSLTDEIDNNQ